MSKSKKTTAEQNALRRNWFPCFGEVTASTEIPDSKPNDCHVIGLNEREVDTTGGDQVTINTVDSCDSACDRLVIDEDPPHSNLSLSRDQSQRAFDLYEFKSGSVEENSKGSEVQVRVNANSRKQATDACELWSTEENSIWNDVNSTCGGIVSDMSPYSKQPLFPMKEYGSGNRPFALESPSRMTSTPVVAPVVDPSQPQVVSDCDKTPTRRDKGKPFKYTPEQRRRLEDEFRKDPSCTKIRKQKLAAVLGVPVRAVKTFFQNAQSRLRYRIRRESYTLSTYRTNAQRRERVSLKSVAPLTTLDYFAPRQEGKVMPEALPEVSGDDSPESVIGDRFGIESKNDTYNPLQQFLLRFSHPPQGTPQLVDAVSMSSQRSDVTSGAMMDASSPPRVADAHACGKSEGNRDRSEGHRDRSEGPRDRSGGHRDPVSVTLSHGDYPSPPSPFFSPLSAAPVQLSNNSELNWSGTPFANTHSGHQRLPPPSSSDPSLACGALDLRKPRSPIVIPDDDVTSQFSHEAAISRPFSVPPVAETPLPRLPPPSMFLSPQSHGTHLPTIPAHSFGREDPRVHDTIPSMFTRLPLPTFSKDLFFTPSPVPFLQPTRPNTDCHDRFNDISVPSFPIFGDFPEWAEYSSSGRDVSTPSHEWMETFL